SRIGRIAAQGKAHLTNELASEPDDPAWPTCEGMVAFAGYPLAVEGRVAGVLAMVADTPIPVAFLQELAPLADGIAQYIERKRAQAALVESDKQFRNLADSIPQLAFKAQPDGFVHWFNQRWYEYTGSALESMEGAGWLALVDPDDRDRVARSWTDCIRSGDPFDEVFGLRAADGGYRRFLTRVVPVRDHRGHIFRWFGTLTDVTEQQEVEAALRASEEALKEADRRKDEFLATLAHELRNPLAPIWNSLEILKATQGDPALLAQAIATMERQVGQMVRLIDDLLDISRITRNKLELRKERVALADMVRAAVETSRPLIAAGHHTLRVSVPDEPVHLDADPTRLAQVLANLLNNSAKYTEPGGTITLAAECRDREVVIAVRDTGVGIPPEMLPRIFEMFTQVEQSLDRAQGGLGIGLTLVQRLLAMHGGRVEAHSDGPGTGSTFTVYLPVLEECPPTADGAVDGAVHDGQQRRTGPSRRILVVDDNRDLAMSLAILLRIAGHEVRVAHDGPAAVAAAAEFEPAVILLDIGLPKMNGYETARAIRQEPWGSRVRLVAVTGWGQEEDRRKSAEAGFDHHLVKPVEPALLQSLLDSLDELAPVPAE
ncbi:MAG TPA: ATP-binding protein, partial [bacterium]|nr:ATP-binding protein [bacterium]